MIMKIPKILFLALLALLFAGLPGCRSATQPGSTSHAVVQINGHALEEIQATAAGVFGENGYSETSRNSQSMTFQRPGSRREAAKYGGWSGEGVTMRVKVAFTPLAGGHYMVQADAFAERNSSDPFFREENRALMLNRRPYQKLLDEVEKRLSVR
jgi:hypothetical protein